MVYLCARRARARSIDKSAIITGDKVDGVYHIRESVLARAQSYSENVNNG